MNLICRESKERAGVDVVIDSPTSGSSIPLAFSHNLNTLFVYAVLFFLMKKNVAIFVRKRESFSQRSSSKGFRRGERSNLLHHGTDDDFCLVHRIGSFSDWIENFRVISSLGRAKNESVSRFGDTRFIRESFLVYRFYYFSFLKFYDTIKFTISSILSPFLSFRLELVVSSTKGNRLDDPLCRLRDRDTKIAGRKKDRSDISQDSPLPGWGERLGWGEETKHT